VTVVTQAPTPIGRPSAPVINRATRRVASVAKLRNFFAGFLGLVLVAAIFAPLVAPHDPNAQDIINRLAPPAWLSGGSMSHLLGTDELGRDILSRIIYGARTSVLIGIAVVGVTMVIGVLLGLIAGYIGGWVETVIMRIVDIQFAFPGLLLSMAVVLVLGASAHSVIIALSIDGWLVYCRLSRSMVLSVRNTTYVEAAKTIGCSSPRLLRKHVLPNIVSPLITLATLEFARIVLAEATLSFLGLGIQPPLVSWGLMLNNGEDYITVAWWLITFPGLVLTLTVLSANVVASWLRVAADPLQRAGAK
jgi:peptide/nickel transport system permease protein